MEFSVKFLTDKVMWPSSSEVEVKTIKNELTYSDRWSLYYDIVFEFKGKFYLFEYFRGATEIQDHNTFSGLSSSDTFWCPEVKPVEKTIIEYVNVEGGVK